MLGGGLLTRVAAYAVFALGFWLLFQGFDRPSPALGILGGSGVLLGMYLMVSNRRGRPNFLQDNTEPGSGALDHAESPLDDPANRDERI